MLRRPPTTLTLTSEDIASYEDRRAAERMRPQPLTPSSFQDAQQALQQPTLMSILSKTSAARPTILDEPQPPPAPDHHHHRATRSQPHHLRSMQERSSPSPPSLGEGGEEGEEEEEEEQGMMEEEDEEMADYDAMVPGTMQSLPRSGRPDHGAVTPTFGHNGAGASHIPQAPSRAGTGRGLPQTQQPRGHRYGAATTRGAAATAQGRGVETRAQAVGSGNGTTRTGEAEGRMTRSRDERIGLSGTRRALGGGRG